MVHVALVTLMLVVLAPRKVTAAMAPAMTRVVRERVMATLYGIVS